MLNLFLINSPTITPSSILSEKYNNSEVIGSSKSRSKKIKKKKHLVTYFISTKSIVFLGEGGRNTILKMTHKILNVKDDPRTFYQAMSSRDVVF